MNNMIDLTRLITPQKLKMRVTCTAKWVLSSCKNQTLNCDDEENNVFDITNDTIKNKELFDNVTGKFIFPQPEEDVANIIKEIIKIKPLYNKKFKDSIQINSIEPETGEIIQYSLSDIVIYVSDGEKGEFKEAYPHSNVFDNIKI